MSELTNSYSELVANFGASSGAPLGEVLPFESAAVTEDVFAADLRRWRNQQMAAIAAADIAGQLAVKPVLEAVTVVAERAIEAAVAFHLELLSEKFGRCVTAEGLPLRFVVLGMGKLGGRELNFSSDIDLICLYDQPGRCEGGKQLSAEEFFGRLVKAISATLGKITADGFVFRVDLRLRPFGGSGPLVMHFDQAENYYEAHGRDWERYAFIKARPVAGDLNAGNEFLERIQAFIYRRYLDFTALHGLRELKSKIEKQYASKRLGDNVKLGPGGIRELEFIAQSFQLVRGGQQLSLQTQSFYKALQAAAELALLEQEVANKLLEAYEFLRVVENRLQQRADQQVHHLPQSDDERALLAKVLGFDDWAGFCQALDVHRAFVARQFSALLVSESGEVLEAAAVTPAVQAKLDALLDGNAYSRLSARAAGFVDEIIKRLATVSVDNPELVQLALLRIIDRILGRSTYLALLAEQPRALERLAFFVGRSQWMAEQVEAQPHLLDDLLDDRNIRLMPNRAEKQQELQAVLRQVAEGDLEVAMDATRRFKSSMQFRIAAADVAGHLPVMKVSDHLTDLAEVILQTSLDWVAAELQSRTGKPQLQQDQTTRDAQMVVIGYGKLGGIELGYGSDLDLVLLHDSEGRALGTDGPKSLENAVYFQRLGQRYVHFLSANTPSGRLYEIDTRLRPSGNSGLLVASIQGYEQYQKKDAWTWEHQALVRARAVAGPSRLREQFSELRLALLATPRKLEDLKRDVIEMRNKMREHLDDSAEGKANLKHGAGGMVDIEFICQYLVLALSSESGCQFDVTDNMRQIEALAAQSKLSSLQAEQLQAAYVAIRGTAHHQKLGCGLESSSEELGNHCQQVVAIWQELLE